MVDLACGTGTVSELIAERIEGSCLSRMVGVDLSAEALCEAGRRLKRFTNQAIQLVQARVEELSDLVRQQVDAVFLCNAIHYLQNKREVLAAAYRVLRTGGRFAFNTTFFEGAQPPETLAFYRRWMLKALRTLKERYGESPNRDKVEARQQLTPEEYRALLQEAGFEIVSQELLPVVIPEEGWLAISGFADFASGALPGISLDRAVETLRSALRQTFAELKLDGVRRNWLSVVAVRA
ncbi:Ubiquinone/menaquinone biosynthesis C-methyltransferase UbiE [bacterium HR33]|nr:Ubiquinone/menaquinone biosynthesis C-methyltransferase UbiE [bacterium HR33]